MNGEANEIIEFVAAIRILEFFVKNSSSFCLYELFGYRSRATGKRNVFLD